MMNLIKQAVILFVAIEEEKKNDINDIKSVNYKSQNEVEEYTEIWELVKK